MIYRTGDGHLHELNWTGVAPVIYGGNLTGAISAPPAAGDPSAFVNANGDNIVVYRSSDGHIRSVYWLDGPSGLDDLSGFAGTPPAAGDPVAYYTAHDDTHQVVYRGGDGHLYELYWPGVAPVVGWDLTAPSGAPAAAGNPAAYYSVGADTKHIIYRSADGRLHEIRWVPGGGTPAHVDLLTAFAGAPPAADRPAAFTVEGPNSQHVAYRGTDNHIYAEPTITSMRCAGRRDAQLRDFEHLIRDEADFNRHLDYMHWNPVKHGYVAQVSHWPYSSFHWDVKKGGYHQIGEATSNHSTALTSANELARTRALRSLGPAAQTSVRDRDRAVPPCGGTLKIIAAIEHPPVITKIVTHLGLPARAPPRAAARAFDRFQLA